MQESWRELKQLAKQLKREGKSHEAAKYFREAAIGAKTTIDTLSANPRASARVYNSLAEIYLEGDDLGLAEKAARESIRMQEEFNDSIRENERLATFCVMLVRVLEKQNRFCDAKPYIDRVVLIFTEIYGEEEEYVKGLRDYQKSIEDNRWRG